MNPAAEFSRPGRGRPAGHGHGLRTFRTMPIHPEPRLCPGEVPLQQLKRDLLRGIRHFYAQRPELHRDALPFNDRLPC